LDSNFRARELRTRGENALTRIRLL
jgi:hypothetical protein